MTDKSPIKKCVFCGERAGNGEHVFPDWLSKQYGGGNSTVVMQKEGRKPIAWKSKIFQGKVKSVCASCNNGWMSDIENRVQGYLGNMSMGKNIPINLNEKQQKDVAIWAQKTILVMQSTFPADERNASPAMYNEFYERKDTLLASCTFIGFNEIAKGADGHISGIEMFSAKTLKIKKEDMTYFEEQGLDDSRFVIGVIKLGHVNLHVIATDMQNLTFGAESPHGGTFQMISPQPEFSNINWPTTFPAEIVGGWKVIHESIATNLHVERP